MNKKAYITPCMVVVNMEQTAMICTSQAGSIATSTEGFSYEGGIDDENYDIR